MNLIVLAVGDGLCRSTQWASECSNSQQLQLEIQNIFASIAHYSARVPVSALCQRCLRSRRVRQTTRAHAALGQPDILPSGSEAALDRDPHLPRGE